MDSAVGRVLSSLDELGVAEDTFVVFASDHGCHIDRGREGGSNRPFSGDPFLTTHAHTPPQKNLSGHQKHQ